METLGSSSFMATVCLFICLVFGQSMASTQYIGKISPGFQGSQMGTIDNEGLFLLSGKSKFAFGFQNIDDVTLFQLVILRFGTSTVVWSANRGSPVLSSDKITFTTDGNVHLSSGGSVIWSTNTGGKGVSVMELLDSGNLVLRGNDSKVIWQSFSYPTDTLLSDQGFVEGMKLVSNPNPKNNVSYFLKIQSDDAILYAGYETPQPYWSMGKETGKTINRYGGQVSLAKLVANSWNFYDGSGVLLWQFTFPGVSIDPNSTSILVLGMDGMISVTNFLNDAPGVPSSTKIPSDTCATPDPCSAYSVCSSGNTCSCPPVLSSNCKSGNFSSCDSKGLFDLVDMDADYDYFALDFVGPSKKTSLNECKNTCLDKCSCAGLFFENVSGNCFMFDQIGSLQSSTKGTYFSSIKVLSSGSNNGGNKSSSSSNKHFPYVILIVFATVAFICVLLYVGYRVYHKKAEVPESPGENSDDDNFLESLSHMPIRFTYKELEAATNNFSIKLGQGGFGSVYQGALHDGTRLAVKQLEGIGQGKKEFRAEVSIIGSIHHVHLVRLRGFCAEGTHRLLVYEYMANGSLDRWIFKKNKDGFLLDWEARFNIALGTAKGLAYLHEDCDVKIVHCDIKPENVLLDENFMAKVSDFGLAKLMTREQSHVFTTLRGTRGYLAPEWITNYAISEKSDVYSYGMVLLELIGGRKNYDANEVSEKSHFPAYAFKMLEEGKLKEILDANLKIEDEDERVFTAIKVALWCIQEDMSLRPPMTKVVQMLEGICVVPPPPTSSQMASRLYSSFYKSGSEGGTSSGPSDCNSEAYLSAVRLSGPR